MTDEKNPPALRPPGASIPNLEGPDAPVEPKEAPRVDDPGLLEKVFNRATVAGPGAMSHQGDIVPRKRISFDVDGSDCAPGMFVDGAGNYLTFRLGLASLTSGEEISVTKGVSDPAEAVQVTAKAALELLNGAPILGDQIDFVWEALGSGGRQLVLTMYQEIGAITPVGLGKALASSTKG